MYGALWEGDMAAYQYLLGLPSFAIRRHFESLLKSSFPRHKYDCSQTEPFLRTLTEHRDFSKCANEMANDVPNSPTPLDIAFHRLFPFIDKETIDDDKFRDGYEALEMLLNAGADSS